MLLCKIIDSLKMLYFEFDDDILVMFRNLSFDFLFSRLERLDLIVK